ncbi:RHS repeat-associated core domain-containing protein [Pseudomonas sp. REP124]|uniref:RHS repeat-associated core domain-containing protein n=1 Tax=Pseudomonas sp. REP124 TaxID=2875731 RepID=UPI002961EBC8|nr:RHS repeat-associated core domain-containing protein [Pseudomonas sp. REP124]
MSAQRSKTILLASDQQRSVLRALDGVRNHPIAYTAYGHRSFENRLLRLLGFNGELADLLTGRYHLGKGYRQFDTVLMRSNKPDDLSPFSKGGLNAYAYCNGDPRNKSDPSGHTPIWLKAFLRSRGLMTRSKPQAVTATPRVSLIPDPDPAQPNTQTNVIETIPDDARPEEITRLQIRLETNRQSRSFNLRNYPETALYKQSSYVLIGGKVVKTKKAYSTAARAHHNSLITPESPKQTSRVTFQFYSVIHVIHEQVDDAIDVKNIRD